MDIVEIIGIVAGAITTILGSLGLFMNRSKISNYFSKGKTDRLELKKQKRQERLAKRALKSGDKIIKKLKDEDKILDVFHAQRDIFEKASKDIEKD